MGTAGKIAFLKAYKRVSAKTKKELESIVEAAKNEGIKIAIATQYTAWIITEVEGD